MESGLEDASVLLDMAVEEKDEDSVQAVQLELDDLESQLATLEFRRMFSQEMDPNHAFLDIQAGFWWYRSARLGQYVITYVFALGRRQGI